MIYLFWFLFWLSGWFVCYWVYSRIVIRICPDEDIHNNFSRGFISGYSCLSWFGVFLIIITTLLHIFGEKILFSIVKKIEPKSREIESKDSFGVMNVLRRE